MKNKSVRNGLMFIVAGFILTILVAVSCAPVSESNRANDVRQKEVYTYDCIDKKEKVGSHYNLLTDKQVVETEYYLILREHGSSTIVTYEVSLSKYYQYEVGKTYMFYYKLH